MMQQGVLLVAEDPGKVSVTNGQRCPANAPTKEYNVSAINIEITLSRFLDYFPGYMYVLSEDVQKARAEEASTKRLATKRMTPVPSPTVCRETSFSRSSFAPTRAIASS